MATDTYFIKNDMSLFWGGPYSQWENVPFIFNDVEYNCNEQFMMRFKALVHEDKEIADKVMVTLFPNEQKKLGRKVKGFTEDKWTRDISMAVVYIANYCKFTQNQKSRTYLLEDPAQVIVEASPYDKIWGIGLGHENPLAWDTETWEGENRLGDCIGKVKNHIMHPNMVSRLYHDWAMDVVMDILDWNEEK